MELLKNCYSNQHTAVTMKGVTLRYTSSGCLGGVKELEAA